MRREIERVLHRFFVAGLATQLAAILSAAAIAIMVWGSLESRKKDTLIREAIEAQKSQIAEYVFVSDVLGSPLPAHISQFETVQTTLQQHGIRGRLDLLPCSESDLGEFTYPMSVGERRLSHCIRFTPKGLGLTWAFGLIVGFGGICLVIAISSWRALKSRVMGRVLDPLLEKIEEGIRHRMLGEMASQVSHDMRSPLAALKAASSGLAADDPSRELIQLAVARLNGITEQLLGTRRSIEAMVSDVRTVMKSLVEEKKLEFAHPISLRVGAQVPHPVLADQNDLSRTLSNLINNAVEASPPGSSIEMELSHKESFVEVAIRDCGPGFPDHILAGLRRGVHHTTKTNGNGLGLKGALQFARNVGGEVRLRNLSQRGAEAVLRIPVAR